MKVTASLLKPLKPPSVTRQWLLCSYLLSVEYPTLYLYKTLYVWRYRCFMNDSIGQGSPVWAHWITYTTSRVHQTIRYKLGDSYNRPSSQIPQCIRQISHNAPLCNRNVHTCTFLLQNGALWDMGLVYCGICVTGLLLHLKNVLCHLAAIAEATVYWYPTS